MKLSKCLIEARDWHKTQRSYPGKGILIKDGGRISPLKSSFGVWGSLARSQIYWVFWFSQKKLTEGDDDDNADHDDNDDDCVSIG